MILLYKCPQPLLETGDLFGVPSGMGMDANPQSRADAEEARNDAQYERLQRLMDQLVEPIRRADGLARLEAWLRLNPPPSTSAPG